MIHPDVLKTVANILKSDISSLQSEGSPNIVIAALAFFTGMRKNHTPAELKEGRLFLANASVSFFDLNLNPEKFFPDQNMNEIDVNELKLYINSYIRIYLNDPKKSFSEIEARANNEFNIRNAPLPKPTLSTSRQTFFSSSSTPTPHTSDIPVFKIMLLGGSKVGKSALVEHLKGNPFSEVHKKTNGFGMDPIFLNKAGQVTERNPAVKLTICDTPSEKEFLENQVYTRLRTANAFIVVFNCCDKKSLENIESIVKEFSKRNLNKPIILVGTHSGSKEAIVTPAKMSAIAKNVGVSDCYMVDSKTGQGYAELLQKMVNVSLPHPTIQSAPPRMG